MLDGGGARWWDGKGSNGGVTKPKFFYAHSLTTSSITGLNIKNTPVQTFSIDGVFFHIPENEHNGEDTLHSSFIGYDQHNWTVVDYQNDSITFELYDEGY